jgi:hypothetical protein
MTGNPADMLHSLKSKSKTDHNDSAGGKTPQFVIRCKDVFVSTMDGDRGADGTPCMFVNNSTFRLASFNSSGEQSGDGRVVLEDVVIRMLYGGHAPIIRERLWAGKVTDKIVVERLLSANGKMEAIQTLTCEMCLFTSYGQDNDEITFAFSYVKICDLSTAFDSTGQPIGNVAASFDAAKAVSKREK